MLKRIDIIAIDDTTYAPFSIEVQQGDLRAILTSAKAPSLITNASGEPLQAQVLPIPALVFEINPETTKQLRSFIWLRAGEQLSVSSSHKFLMPYVDEISGQPLFLYEIIS